MRNDISVRAAFGAGAVLALALSSCTPYHKKTDGGTPVPYNNEAAAPATEPAVEAQPAEPVELQENAPMRYVVQKGDTLWSISNKFLKDPWQWPEVWYVNGKVANPHLIYPGDELVLYFTGDNQPHIAKAGETPTQVAEMLPPGGLADVRPRARESALDSAIYAIPLDAIRAFLRGPRLIDEDELDDAPYVVDFEADHLMAAQDDIAYVLALDKRDVTQYQIVRRGHEYRDPDDNDVIGYEVLPVAEGEVRAFGDPSSVYLKSSTMESLKGDYLLPQDPSPLALRFIPHAPGKPVDGKIVSVYNGVSEIGQWQIVAINRGVEQGMEPGHVLKVYQSGRKSKDPYSFFGSMVQLPDVQSGTLLVFKTSPRLSYALVMDATRPIHLLDRVEKPDLAR